MQTSARAGIQAQGRTGGSTNYRAHRWRRAALRPLRSRGQAQPGREDPRRKRLILVKICHQSLLQRSLCRGERHFLAFGSGLPAGWEVTCCHFVICCYSSEYLFTSYPGISTAEVMTVPEKRVLSFSSSPWLLGILLHLKFQRGENKRSVVFVSP